ncbi:MBL fold metallo-hydrolase [Natronomonas sp. LN261]|uniref:MBL fold metallo-hydrolase n=1 Tax=Natronomonas sp. LN261 TaxID=2750669 RepID=UPI0015EE9FBA
MNIQFLGGAGEVGRSAILINGSLLLDFGMKTDDPPQYPVGDVSPDAVVVSHGHLDHVGAIPSLLSGRDRPPIHWTPPTYELAMTLAADTLKLHGGTPLCPFTEEERRRVTEVSELHGYREPFTAAGHRVELFNAGHIPGSAHVLVDDGDTRLFYTGDFHTDDQRLVSASTDRPDADVVICESTYADVEHDPRERVEKRFLDSVRTTLWEGGTVVVPAFAIGRTQELMLLCAAHDIDCYVDGMGVDVTRMLRRYPEFLRDADSMADAKTNARTVTGRDGKRRRIAGESTVIVTTAGMLSGGPAMTYIPEIHANPINKICFSGYQVEGTPGRQLLETGSAEIDGRHLQVSAQLERYDFSAHADRDGLRAFLGAYEDTPILLNHGDSCGWFAEQLRGEGFDTTAPALGDSIDVPPGQHS